MVETKFVCPTPVRNLERRKVYCRMPSKENGQLMLKRPELPNSFAGRIKGKIWNEGFRVCDFLLIGWW